jgi:tripartite-type tricarboxylate transporter receptor subunit TctC
MHRSDRRAVLRAATAFAATVALPARLAAQETFPSRPIRLIVPYAPGGISDVMARVIGKALSEQVGQTVVVENRPGGGTVIGTEAAVRAKPDGYTVLLVSAPVATNPGLYAKLPYDALRDLAPLVALSGQGFVVSVGASQPWKTFGELVEAARRPGAEIPYASPGIGTLMHLSAQLANVEYGTRFVHVPYKGSGPALQDAIAGQVPVIVDPASTSLAPIRQGRLRPLAVTHPTRLATLPDVPTVRELGFPKLEATAFAGLMVPAGTPPEIVARLNAELNRAMKNPEVHDKLVVQMGQTLIGGTPEAFGAQLRVETERWAPLVRRLGISAE